jgi:hypothetical protein
MATASPDSTQGDYTSGYLIPEWLSLWIALPLGSAILTGNASSGDDDRTHAYHD